MPAPALPPSITRPIDLVVLHCSATPSGQRLDAGRRTTPGVIDGWHQARGFARAAAARSAYNWRLTAIGYHWVIGLDGYVWTGRHPNEIGAHAVGYNTRSLGVCLVGGAEPVARYSAAQWASLAELVTLLQGRFKPLRIVGHRDLSPDLNGDGEVEPREWLKTCPGFGVARWLASGMQPLAQHQLPQVR